jgi:disulfide bond formation protein DsbB
VIATRWYWLGMIGSGALLAIAYFYFQLSMGLVPCPLCMFQRVCLIGVMVLCLMGIIGKPKVLLSKLLAFGVLLFSSLGLLFAGRQTWLQYLPADEVPECGPGLEFMLEVFPLAEVIETVFSGSGECAEVQWQLFGFSMGEWMVLVFSVYVLVSLRLLFIKERKYFSGAYI